MMLTKKGLTGYSNDLSNELKNEFTEKQCIVINKFIDDDLINKILSNLKDSDFVSESYLGKSNKIFASNLNLVSKSIAFKVFNFILNNQDFFSLIEEVTGCRKIDTFKGRIYKIIPDTEQQLDWHDDMNEINRVIALSLNLSPRDYEGGAFQIRKKGSVDILREVVNTQLGDIHIFNISPDLEHRVMKTSGAFPRTAGAGWFLSNHK